LFFSIAGPGVSTATASKHDAPMVQDNVIKREAETLTIH
jgi:hypothetical protein